MCTTPKVLIALLPLHIHTSVSRRNSFLLLLLQYRSRGTTKIGVLHVLSPTCLTPCRQALPPVIPLPPWRQVLASTAVRTRICRALHPAVQTRFHRISVFPTCRLRYVQAKGLTQKPTVRDNYKQVSSQEASQDEHLHIIAMDMYLPGALSGAEQLVAGAYAQCR